MVARLRDTAQTLEGLGHEVVERGLGVDYRAMYRAQGLASAGNFAAGVKEWVALHGREPREGELGPLARRAYEAGKRLTAEQAFQGLRALRLHCRKILENWESFDVFLTPTMSTPSPRVSWLDPLMDDTREFDRRQGATYGTTPPFNFTGQPSISLPLWQSEDGLPIGMMFTGRFADEATLLRLSGQLEKELPWKDRRPPVWG